MGSRPIHEVLVDDKVADHSGFADLMLHEVR